MAKGDFKTVTLQRDLVDRAKKTANKKGMSLASFINDIVRTELANENQKKEEQKTTNSKLVAAISSMKKQIDFLVEQAKTKPVVSAKPKPVVSAKPKPVVSAKPADPKTKNAFDYLMTLKEYPLVCKNSTGGIKDNLAKVLRRIFHDWERQGDYRYDTNKIDYQKLANMYWPYVEKAK